MYENLSFHREFLRKLKICKKENIFAKFYIISMQKWIGFKNELGIFTPPPVLFRVKMSRGLDDWMKLKIFSHYTGSNLLPF